MSKRIKPNVEVPTYTNHKGNKVPIHESYMISYKGWMDGVDYSKKKTVSMISSIKDKMKQKELDMVVTSKRISEALATIANYQELNIERIAEIKQHQGDISQMEVELAAYVTPTLEQARDMVSPDVLFSTYRETPAYKKHLLLQSGHNYLDSKGNIKVKYISHDKAVKYMLASFMSDNQDLCDRYKLTIPYYGSDSKVYKAHYIEFKAMLPNDLNFFEFNTAYKKSHKQESPKYKFDDIYNKIKPKNVEQFFDDIDKKLFTKNNY